MLLHKNVHNEERDLEKKASTKKAIVQEMKPCREKQIQILAYEKGKENLEEKHRKACRYYKEIKQIVKKIRLKQDGLAEELCQLRSNLKTQKEQFERKQEEMKEMELSVMEKTKRIQCYVECEEKLCWDVSKLEGDLDDALDRLKAETAGLQETRNLLEAELVDLQRDLAHTRDRYEEARAELDLKLSEQKSEEEKLERLETTLNDICVRSRQLQTETENGEVLLEALEKKKASVKAELENLRELKEGKSRELMLLQTAVRENEKALQSQRVSSFLQRRKDTGLIPGVYGRLGDLGVVEEKYDVALSSACAELDSIVVDTVETRKMCMHVLEFSKVGRCKFIPLYMLQHLDTKSPVKILTPKGFPRLFDLVTVKEERFKKAFYHALGDSLVAEDLEQVKKIVPGRYRVVTLKGEVIEPSGTMSRNAFNPRGLMGRSVPEKEQMKEQMKESALGLKREIAELKRKQANLQLKLRKQEKRMRAYTADIMKRNDKSRLLSDQKLRVEIEVRQQLKKYEDSKLNPEEVQVMRNIVDKTGEKCDILTARVSASEKEIRNFDEYIRELKHRRVGTVQINLHQLKEERKRVLHEKTELEEETKTAEMERQKCQESILALSDLIVEIEDQITETVQKQEELERECKSEVRAQKRCRKKLSLLKAKRQKKVSTSALKAKLQYRLLNVKTELDNLETVEARLSATAAKLGKLASFLSGVILELRKQPFNLSTLQPHQSFPPNVLEKLDVDKLKEVVTEAEKLDKSFAANKPNLNIVEEYVKHKVLHKRRYEDFVAVSKKMKDAETFLDALTNRRSAEFVQGVTDISKNLTATFRTLTQGGIATCELVDPSSPFSGGITFSVRPPLKRRSGVSVSANEEQTLSALSLIFALHDFKPSPLYLMDEVGAALRSNNWSIIQQYLKARMTQSQFFIIAPNSRLSELAEQLTEVRKISSQTQLRSISQSVFSGLSSRINENLKHKRARRDDEENNQ